MAQQSIGLTGFGGYIPRLRLQRKAVVQANAWVAPNFAGRGKGERSMANWDEDSVTMAVEAARDASGAPDLALLISCVGRKLVLKQRTEEELEAVRDVLGPATALTGFYSYGEICPSAPHAGCELHNQTMTITTFTEA